jgi:death on curing protein
VIFQFCAYATAFNANHLFIDENKRVSFHALLMFPRLDGFILRVPGAEVMEEMLAQASGRVIEADLRVWVRGNITASG